MQVTSERSLKFEVDYSTKVPGVRTIELPTIMAELADLDELRVVVLAGNSGEIYANTRHNLAWAFGRYLAATRRPVTNRAGDPHQAYPATITVTYDNGDQSSWNTTFATESPHFRRSSGEVFFYPDLGGAPVVVVQAIGDYNEVGDFAVPILDALGLKPDRLLIVHDDLKSPEKEISLHSGVQKYTGNNAVFSIIRTLSYGLWPELRALFELHLPVGAEVDWGQAEGDFRKRADVRQPGHLGDSKIFAKAFKNVDLIASAISTLGTRVSELETQYARSEVEALRSEKKAADKDIKAFLKVNGNGGGDLDSPDPKISDLQQKSKAVASKISNIETMIGLKRQALKDGVRAVIARRLIFGRLAIGSDNGHVDFQNLPDFVTAPYPSDVFTNEVWEEVALKLEEWVHTSGAEP